jgi:hypothetical protein
MNQLMNLSDQQPQNGKQQAYNQNGPFSGIESVGGAGLQGKVELVSQGTGGNLIDALGKAVKPPKGWEFLPAGDAGLTRKVTTKTGIWRVQARMGRRVISKGIWAPSVIIAEARREVEAQRATEGYQKKKASDRQRRERKQAEYEGEFLQAVRAYLAFAPNHAALERAMAEAVTAHAVPVGSGTVARTAMLPIEERAAKAVIAWMRHRTTAYDSMTVARIKGERRQVRRMLAQRSVELLRAYRAGGTIGPDCPLQRALGHESPAPKK